jgi:hypothetical protein
MGMTPHPGDCEAYGFQQPAEPEHRSMQDVTRHAIREYVESNSQADLLERVLDEELPRYAEALKRLGSCAGSPSASGPMTNSALPSGPE